MDKPQGSRINNCHVPTVLMGSVLEQLKLQYLKKSYQTVYIKKKCSVQQIVTCAQNDFPIVQSDSTWITIEWNEKRKKKSNNKFEAPPIP